MEMKVMKTKCLTIETDGEQALKEGHWSFEAAKIILRGLPEWRYRPGFDPRLYYKRP
jgi:hypothetical protein